MATNQNCDPLQEPLWTAPFHLRVEPPRRYECRLLSQKASLEFYLLENVLSQHLRVSTLLDQGVLVLRLVLVRIVANAIVVVTLALSLFTTFVAIDVVLVIILSNRYFLPLLSEFDTELR